MNKITFALIPLCLLTGLASADTTIYSPNGTAAVSRQLFGVHSWGLPGGRQLKLDRIGPGIQGQFGPTYRRPEAITTGAVWT